MTVGVRLRGASGGSLTTKIPVLLRVFWKKESSNEASLNVWLSPVGSVGIQCRYATHTDTKYDPFYFYVKSLF